MKESDNYSSATFKLLDRREENCIYLQPFLGEDKVFYFVALASF